MSSHAILEAVVERCWEEWRGCFDFTRRSENRPREGSQTSINLLSLVLKTNKKQDGHRDRIDLGIGSVQIEDEDEWLFFDRALRRWQVEVMAPTGLGGEVEIVKALSNRNVHTEEKRSEERGMSRDDLVCGFIDRPER